jgi:hypothetical protein
MTTEIPGLTRRLFIRNVGLLLGASAVPKALASVPEIDRMPLYVHHEAGGLLSLGHRYDEFQELPGWTWRQFIALENMGDYEAFQFDERTEAYAHELFEEWTGGEVSDTNMVDYLAWLDEPHPDRETSEFPCSEWYFNNDAGTAQAYSLIGMLGLGPEEDSEGWGEEDGIGVEAIPYRSAAVMSHEALTRLKTAIVSHNLPIDLIETGTP